LSPHASSAIASKALSAATTNDRAGVDLPRDSGESNSLDEHASVDTFRFEP
jgi:hypothetical protein